MKFIQTQTSFRSGYIGERFEGRYDLQEFQNGCRALTNMFITKSGTAVKAPGLVPLDYVEARQSVSTDISSVVSGEATAIAPDRTSPRLISMVEMRSNGEEYLVYFFESDASGSTDFYIRVVSTNNPSEDTRIYPFSGLPHYCRYTDQTVTEVNTASYEDRLYVALKFGGDSYSVPPFSFTVGRRLSGLTRTIYASSSPTNDFWWNVPNQSVSDVTIQTHTLAASNGRDAVRLTLSSGTWADYIDTARLQNLRPTVTSGDSGVVVMLYGEENNAPDGEMGAAFTNAYFIGDTNMFPDNSNTGGSDTLGFHTANVLAQPYLTQTVEDVKHDSLKPGAGKAWRIQSWGTEDRGWPRNVAVDDGRLIFFDVPGKRATLYASYVGEPQYLTNARIQGDGISRVGANVPRQLLGSIINTDAYQFTLASRRAVEITFVSTDRDMVVGTTAGAFLVNGVDEIVGPLSIEARPFYSYPCSGLFAELENGLVYASDTREALILLEYHPSNGGLSGKELSLLASDRFVGDPIDGMTYDPRSGVLLLYRNPGTAEAISISSSTGLFAFSNMSVIKDIERVVYSEVYDSFVLLDSDDIVWKWGLTNTIREGDTPVPYLNNIEYISSLRTVGGTPPGGMRVVVDFLVLQNVAVGDVVTVVEDSRNCLLYTSDAADE